MIMKKGEWAEWISQRWHAME